MMELSTKQISSRDDSDILFFVHMWAFFLLSQLRARVIHLGLAPQSIIQRARTRGGPGTRAGESVRPVFRLTDWPTACHHAAGLEEQIVIGHAQSALK